MSFEKVIVFTGREEDNGLSKESYQLLLGLNFISYQYRELDGDYQEFLEIVSTEFAERIAEHELALLEIGTMNGFKLEDGKLVRIDKLEDCILTEFAGNLTTKISELMKGRALTVSAEDLADRARKN